jgi:hypothetical protein
MSGIEFLLERLQADTAVGIEEALTGPPQSDVGVDQRLDGIGHLVI